MRFQFRVLLVLGATAPVACGETAAPVDFHRSIAQQELQLASAVAASRAPTPDADDRLLLDSRAALQRAMNPQQAIRSLTTDFTGTFDFTSDVDGAGTNALRLDWPATGRCASDERKLITYLPNPLPRRVVVRWKSRLGRSATGGGLGSVDAFSVYSSACGRGGREVLAALRDVHDGGGAGRIDLRWEASSASNVSARITYSGGSVGAIAGMTSVPTPGRSATMTVYLQAESARGARDGAVRVWLDDQLVQAGSGLALGPEAFHRLHLPGQNETLWQAQSEYFWDVVAWEPNGPVGEGSGSGETPPPVVATVSVSLSATALAVGGQAQATATARDASGAVITGRTVSWSSSADTA